MASLQHASKHMRAATKCNGVVAQVPACSMQRKPFSRRHVVALKDSDSHCAHCCSHASKRLMIARAIADEYDSSAATTEISAADAMSKEFALQCAQIVDETKCQDITLLHVAPHISWTSYMLLATVFSRPQLLAAMARIEKMVSEEFPERERKNQPGSSPWECLDYGDVIVHLMTAEQRETYDLEGFYSRAEEVLLPWDQPAMGSNSPSWAKQI